MSKKIRQNGQDIMMNLLDNSSDSGPEPLNLPPIKGKKTKRRKSYASQEMCSLWIFAKVFMTLLVIASIATLSAISFWLVRQVDDLKSQLKTVSLAGQSNLEDYQKLHSQFQEMNKTITNLRTGKSGLDTVYANITDLSEKFQKLKEETDEFKSGFEEYSALKDLPMRVKVLSMLVADMGSNLQDVKRDIASLNTFNDMIKKTLAELRTELEEIKANVVSTSSAPTSTSSPTEKSILPIRGQDEITELQQKITSMEQSLQLVNTSLTSRLSDMQSAMLEHGFRTAALENSTRTMLVDMDLLNLDRENEDKGVEARPMEARVRNILEEMLKNMSITKEEKPFEITGFEAYKQSAAIKFHHLNDSYITLHEDFETLISNVVLNKNQLFIMTQQISGLLRYLTALGYNEGEISNTSVNVSPSSTTSKPVNITELDEVEDETIFKDSSSISTSSTTSSPVLHISNINNAQDLKINYEHWNRDGGDKVSYDDLLNFRPSGQLPSKEQLDQYDEDKDGFYSEQELMTALGFILSP